MDATYSDTNLNRKDFVTGGRKFLTHKGGEVKDIVREQLICFNQFELHQNRESAVVTVVRNLKNMFISKIKKSLGNIFNWNHDPVFFEVQYRDPREKTWPPKEVITHEQLTNPVAVDSECAVDKIIEEKNKEKRRGQRKMDDVVAYYFCKSTTKKGMNFEKNELRKNPAFSKLVYTDGFGSDDLMVYQIHALKMPYDELSDLWRKKAMKQNKSSDSNSEQFRFARTHSDGKPCPVTLISRKKLMPKSKLSMEQTYGYLSQEELWDESGLLKNPIEVNGEKFIGLNCHEILPMIFINPEAFDGLIQHYLMNQEAIADVFEEFRDCGWDEYPRRVFFQDGFSEIRDTILTSIGEPHIEEKKHLMMDEPRFWKPVHMVLTILDPDAITVSLPLQHRIQLAKKIDVWCSYLQNIVPRIYRERMQNFSPEWKESALAPEDVAVEFVKRKRKVIRAAIENAYQCIAENIFPTFVAFESLDDLLGEFTIFYKRYSNRKASKEAITGDHVEKVPEKKDSSDEMLQIIDNDIFQESSIREKQVILAKIEHLHEILINFLESDFDDKSWAFFDDWGLPVKLIDNMKEFREVYIQKDRCSVFRGQITESIYQKANGKYSRSKEKLSKSITSWRKMVKLKNL